jgi:hypothetical protein
MASPTVDRDYVSNSQGDPSSHSRGGPERLCFYGAKNVVAAFATVHTFRTEVRLFTSAGMA